MIVVKQIRLAHKTGHWIATGQIDFEMLISTFWPLGEGLRGFGHQIRLQHAEISPGTNSEVIWLELMGFPKFWPVAIQWPGMGICNCEAAG